MREEEEILNCDVQQYNIGCCRGEEKKKNMEENSKSFLLQGPRPPTSWLLGIMLEFWLAGLCFEVRWRPDQGQRVSTASKICK